MTFQILQWNMKGFVNNFDELSILINEHSPCFISIQETHCAHLFTPRIPKLYTGYFYNFPSNVTAKQGIGVLIKNNIPHKQIIINSNILTLLPLKFTVVSIYILPDQVFSITDLENILNQIPTPVLIIGDVNSWSVLWGSPATSSRGAILEKFLLDSDLMVLNDGSPTHFSTDKTLTHMELTCC